MSLSNSWTAHAGPNGVENHIEAKEPENTNERLQELIQRVDQKYSESDHNTHLTKSAKSPPKKDLQTDHVLTIRRIIDRNETLIETKVDVKSALLKDVLLKINEKVKGHSLKKETAEATPILLYHSSAALKDVLQNEQQSAEPNSLLITHIQVALWYVNDTYSADILDFRTLTAQNEITFSLLQLLFKPQTLVYHHDPLIMADRAFLFGVGAYIKRDEMLFYKAECSYLAWNGKSVGLATLSLQVPQFEGSKKIQELPFYPINLHLNEPTLSQELQSRGQRFLKLCQQSFQEYQGTAVEEIPVGVELERVNFTTNGRVVLDAKTFQNQNPRSRLWPYISREMNFCHRPNDEYVMTPIILNMQDLTCDQLITSSPTHLGFSLATKKWGAFSIDRIKDITWNDQAIENLVIPPEKRRIIHALVAGHDKSLNNFDDFVQNKGKGLIGILEGPPGVGKTLTAEAIAEKTRRPLYMLTAGELGTNPEELENKLVKVLTLARTWNAILLLDEADVFLQVRKKNELDRNAMVSIFLRQLEYFEGILILTTNRVEECDPAFQSRIHFAITYQDLNEDARRSIWQSFINKIRTVSQQPVMVNDAQIALLAGKELNGRQIKNAISSAVKIAQYERKPLDMEHINSTLELRGKWV